MTVAVVEGTKRLYEIMVLYDPADVTKEWDALVESLSGRITKLEGQIVKIDQWADNKKLAYEVKGLRRGSFLTAYFHLDPTQVEALERSLRLDERIVRHVIIVHHRLPPEFAPPKESKEKGKEKGKGEAKTEADAEAKVEAKTEADAEVKVEAKAEADAEVKVEAKTEADAEVKVEAKTEADAEVKVEQSTDQNAEADTVEAPAESGAENTEETQN
jgi:small subunit ribosomal protein S6